MYIATCRRKQPHDKFGKFTEQQLDINEHDMMQCIKKWIIRLNATICKVINFGKKNETTPLQKSECERSLINYLFIRFEM